MNYRSGFSRLLVIVAAIWTLAWGWAAFDAQLKVNRTRPHAEKLQREYAQAEGTDLEGILGHEAEVATELREADRAARNKAVAFGVGGLGALLAVCFAALWVSRGFRSKT